MKVLLKITILFAFFVHSGILQAGNDGGGDKVFEGGADIGEGDKGKLHQAKLDADRALDDESKVRAVAQAFKARGHWLLKKMQDLKIPETELGFTLKSFEAAVDATDVLPYPPYVKGLNVNGDNVDAMNTPAGHAIRPLSSTFDVMASTDDLDPYVLHEYLRFTKGLDGKPVIDSGKISGPAIAKLDERILGSYGNVLCHGYFYQTSGILNDYHDGHVLFERGAESAPLIANLVKKCKSLLPGAKPEEVKAKCALQMNPTCDSDNAVRGETYECSFAIFGGWHGDTNEGTVVARGKTVKEAKLAAVDACTSQYNEVTSRVNPYPFRLHRCEEAYQDKDPKLFTCKKLSAEDVTKIRKARDEKDAALEAVDEELKKEGEVNNADVR